MSTEFPSPADQVRTAMRLIEEESSRTDKDGAEAFLQGDYARAEQLLQRAKDCATSIRILGQLQARLEEPAQEAETPPLAVRRKSRGVTKTNPEPAKATLVAAVSLPVEEAAEPKADQSGKVRIARLVTTLREDCERLLVAETWGESDWALCKSAVCRGRSLAASSTDSTSPGDGARGIVAKVGMKMRALNPTASFFGVDFNRTMAASDWDTLAEAYGLFPTAYEAIEWLESEPEVDHARFAEVLLAVGAVETLVYRILDENTVGVGDDQQRKLNARVRAISECEQIYVPWWNRTQPHRQETKAIRKAAQDLRHLFDTVKKSSRRHAALRRADEMLGSILDTDSLVADFDERLVGAVESVLDAGLPPSDKILRGKLAPFRHYLDSSSHQGVLKLLGHLAHDATKAFASGKTNDPPEPSVDGDFEYDQSLSMVKARLANKTVLFIGGNKGQAWRIPQYKAELGLAELLWPDAEEKTNPGAFSGEIRRCDVAVMLVRWSRHSYKQALDEAKMAGRETMMLTRGLGLRTFVEAYREQVIGSVPAVSLN